MQCLYLAHVEQGSTDDEHVFGAVINMLLIIANICISDPDFSMTSTF